MPEINRLKAKIKAGKPVFGAMITIPSIHVVQILANEGFDYIKIDMEHSPISIESVYGLIVATAGTNTVPVVRVPWNIPWLVKPVLDAGAMGICFPWIRTAQEAQQAVSSMLYGPEGERGWGPFYAHLRWQTNIKDYVKKVNNEVNTEVLIEHIDSIDNLDEIVQTEGLDSCFIAPSDLAISLGVRGEPDHPLVQEQIERAEKVILNSKKAMGGFSTSPDRINQMLDRGYKIITVAFDFMLLQKSAREVLSSINKHS